MILEDSYTHSMLATGRRCLRELELRYLQQLDLIVGDDEAEALQVGDAWHVAHREAARPADPARAYDAIGRHAPSDLWAHKLRRLFAAYHWHWANQGLAVVQPEWSFDVTLEGIRFRGQADAIVQLEDGRRGILERKTSSESVEAESDYWRKLRMEPQTGIYALAYASQFGELPAFILYDVTRKPTIEPKSISQADQKRLKKELEKSSMGLYYSEPFGPEVLLPALEAGRESGPLYGARLTSDIGDRPYYYFARREVSKLEQDYDALLRDLQQQVQLLELCESMDTFPRNPDACHTFGRPCDFFPLCSQNVHPKAGSPPMGYRQREHKHPELAKA